jgi:predicted secreted hydrolase
MELHQLNEQINYSDYEVTEWLTYVDIDKDLVWHKGKYPNESWFVVANLKSNGHKIAFQAHCLIMQVSEDNSVVSLNISVTNQTTGWYKSHEYAYPLEKVNVSDLIFDIRTDDFVLSGNSDHIIVQATFPEVNIDVALKRVEPVLMTCGSGAVPFLGVEQYDYAFPAMLTSGIIELAGTSYEVSGLSWLDRQWGGLPDFFKNPEAINSMKWLWMNLQLDNGERISLGKVIELNTKKLMLMANIMHPDGSITLAKIKPVEMFDYWTSDITGNSYPTRYIVNIPSVEAELEVIVAPRNQEIVSAIGGINKYEGAADVTGTYRGQQVTGVTYVELVGYWK